MTKKIKICLACSAGGHLTEMIQLKECYDKYDHFFITFKREDTIELSDSDKTYFVSDTSRSLVDFVRCCIQTLRILFKERPNIVISTGAGVAVPACYLSKILFRTKIVFLESFCRTNTPSFSGKLVYLVSDKFFVQWEELLEKYGSKAEYFGGVI